MSFLCWSSAEGQHLLCAFHSDFGQRRHIRLGMKVICRGLVSSELSLLAKISWEGKGRTGVPMSCEGQTPLRDWVPVASPRCGRHRDTTSPQPLPEEDMGPLL